MARLSTGWKRSATSSTKADPGTRRCGITKTALSKTLSRKEMRSRSPCLLLRALRILRLSGTSPQSWVPGGAYIAIYVSDPRLRSGTDGAYIQGNVCATHGSCNFYVVRPRCWVVS
jgi:hypothetical protein